ncbi:MAG: hypothetical protein JSS60_02435 [Verrucomicrobia bacterium]|nr:hypothetical protein [Verrucomicrobiota bacterium]
MQARYKQVLPMIALSLAAFTGQRLSAEEMQNGRQQSALCDSDAVSNEVVLNEAQIIGDSQTPSTSMSTAGKGNANTKWRMFDPNSLRNSNDLWIDGEILFWKSNMGSLDYGVTSESPNRIDDGHVKHPEFNWDWGFRLGLGYKLPHDKWDIFVNYTYVHARAHGHAGDSDDVIFPRWASGVNATPNVPFFANSAKAHWHANLNMGDVELGRTCFVSKWLTIRPFIGVRGLVIDQEYSVEYKGGTMAPFDEDKVHMDTDFWGVGIRIGANTLWGLGKGFSIYGNGSVSLLSGDFDVHEHEKLEDADIRLMNIERDVDNVVVTADLALGLQWDYMFSKDRYHFGVKMGWEFDMFFDQNQLFNFLGSNPGSISFADDDLSFQGLTLGFRFDF